MSKDSIALLGTSADPPTIGHQALLEGLLREFPRVVTWASDNPSKRHGAELKQRSDLLNRVVQTIGDPRLELGQDLSSPYAITTLERARQRWPQSPLCFVVEAIWPLKSLAGNTANGGSVSANSGLFRAKAGP